MNKWSILDWEYYSEGVEYSPSSDLYWFNNQFYDPISANHNGIIGLGAQLKTIIKSTNKKD